MIDVNDATFQRDVLDRSAEVPVVVDLWAEWCGPCRTLGPILEKVVAETAVREFVARLAPSQSEADRLAALGDEASLRQALELEHDHPGAVIALAELLAERGEGEDALALLARVPETAETRRVAARARLGSNGARHDDLDARLDSLLERVKEDEAARREFVDLLEMLGADDPRTPRYRKALASRLY